jgi:hypothetical protein
MMDQIPPFVFQTERRLVVLTGRRARNLPEMLDHLKNVSGSSIFYHTHHQYLSHHFEKPVFHNDFAIWVARALLEEPLSEKIAAIDLLAFSSIRQLREAIIKTVESYINEINGRVRECLPGDELHFCESKSFIMPSGIVARDIPDFFAKLPKVSNASLYFHFFEARLRLEKPTNDFSAWLSYCGAAEVAVAIDKLNPYLMTMEELREEIIRLGKPEGEDYDRYTA